MKEKILAAIKQRFPAINLSKKRLEQISAKIESMVIDDDTKVDAALDQYNNFNPLVDIAKADDTQRNLEAKLKVATQQKTKDDIVNPEPQNDDPETPVWAKSLIESNKLLSAKLQAIEGKEHQQTIKQKATSLLKEIPASYWNKRALPENEDKLDDFITDVQTDYKSFTQEMTDKGLTHIPVPGGGNHQVKKEAVSPEVRAFAEKQAKSDTTPKV